MNENKLCSVCGKSYRTEKDYLTGTSRWRTCSAGNLWFNCGCGSTLMIKKGKYDWYSPDKVLGEEARSVFNKLGGLKDLPHVPASVMELQKLLLSADVTPKRVAQELRHDPVMATQVLQIAENIRNARNPGNAKLTSIEHAVVYVGYRPLADLIMTSAIRSMPMPPSSFDADLFWKDSYLTGAIAEVLLHKYHLDLNPDELFLAASLCNLGKLVMAFCFPEQLSKLVRDTSDKALLLTWRKAETRESAPDHGILGEIASTLWGFPEGTMKAARRHHEVPKTDAAGKLALHEVVAVANQLVHWVRMQPHRMEYEIVQAFEKRLKLTERDMEKLAAELTEMDRKMTA